MSRRVPLRWRWTDRWDQGMSRKKLAFYLAEQAQESFVGISVSYHGCLRLFWRWDHYAIPLPFSKVIVAVHDYGEVNKKQIPDLPTRAEVSECGILLKGA